MLGCIHSHPEPHAARALWVGHPCKLAKFYFNTVQMK